MAPPPQIPEPLAAALAARYRIERELGRGGMATVYLAEDLKHHRKVAIKVLDPALAAAVGADRFLREIEIAASLRHPHILPLYDSGSVALPAVSTVPTVPSALFFVMPFVDGESLRARLDREHQLPIDDALRIAREVADALSYAHARNIVHRDIKPENILLEAGHAVVADFGIARAIATAGSATALTGTGMAIGTPAYMSPEQAAGDSDVDGRSDLYSLACVLHEMLAGQPPFAGATVESLVRQHIATPAPPVTQFRPAVPAAVADALARALSKTPADRFNPVGQFASALTAAAAPAVTASTAVPAASTARPATRWRLPAALALIALVAVLWLMLRPGGAAVADSAVARIAVLPLDDLSGDTTGSPLALGMQGEIITELTRLAEVEVTARSSTMEYRGAARDLGRIARELGVTHVLEGSMQRAAGQVRLTFQLVDVATRRQLWAERFDRELTAANLFALQAEVAELVTSALGARFRGGADTAAARPATLDLAALDLYYAAQRIWDERATLDSDVRAARLLENATAIDSGFAAAWALLAVVRSWPLRIGATTDTMPAHLAVTRAERLAPDAVETAVARGYFRYYSLGDIAGARVLFAAAAEARPTAGLLEGLGLLERRLGNWDAAAALLQRSVQLDPRNPSPIANLAECLVRMHRYEEAMRMLDRAHTLAPGSARVAVDRWGVALFGFNDTVRAAALANAAEATGEPALTAFVRYYTARMRRHFDEAAAVLRGTSSIPGFSLSVGVRELELALISRYGGDSAGMRTSARRLVERADSALHVRRQRPSDPFGIIAQAEMIKAFGVAMLGDTAEAAVLGERAYARFPYERDQVEGAELLFALAQLHILSGRHAAALDRLEELRRRPAPLGTWALGLDPHFDPLRGNPRFERLVAEERQ